MALFNYTVKEITLKVVYYGPGFSGKTTNLQRLHTTLLPPTRGKLISLTTEDDRTLFFDFLPVDLGKIKEFNIKFQLYTVPGQVRYNATRRIVLRGADAVVFVADSQREMKEQNIASLHNMMENLIGNNLDPDDIPLIVQYNKRDITNIMSVEELNADLNKDNVPFFEAVAVEDKGVKETFNETIRTLISHITKKYKVDIEAPVEVISPASDLSGVKGTSHEGNKPVTVFPKTRHVEAPAATESAPVWQSPAGPDVSGLVTAVGELKDVMSEISVSLKDIQKKQTRMASELFEIRKIFSQPKQKKGLRGLFR